MGGNLRRLDGADRPLSGGQRGISHPFDYAGHHLARSQALSPGRIGHLYARRWRLELCFRDLKTQMGMEQLRCQTPAMAEKEALAYLVAHNLIRCVMAEAIASYQVELERLSFKGTVDSLRQFTNTMVQARNRKKQRQLWEDLIWNVARDLAPLRPGRRELRAVKHRPKPYPLLTRPRHLFKDRISYSKWLLRKKQSKNRCVI